MSKIIAREAKHPLQFGAKNKTYRRKNRPSLVLIFNPLSNVRNIERVEEHLLDFCSKIKLHRRENHQWLVQELNPLSDVKKNIEWEINICSTLAPKLSLIGGKPDHDWCINEILFLILPMWNSRFGTSFFFQFFFCCFFFVLPMPKVGGAVYTRVRGLYNVNYGTFVYIHVELWLIEYNN